MPTLTRPGVYVDLSSFPTYSAVAPGAAAACFVGTSPRGPTTPTYVTSWKSFVQQYGGFETAYPPGVNDLQLPVFSYFSAGGTSAIIIRAYNTSTSGPVVAFTAFMDQSTAPGLATLQVSAKNPGAWGNNIYISITPGTVMSGTNPITFNLVVYYQGTNPANIVEQWNNISMAESTGQGISTGQNNYALDVINSPYTGSNFITVADLGSASLDPTNNPVATTAPVQLGTAPYSGAPSGDYQLGGDGSAPTATDWQTAYQLLDQYPDQPFVLNLPGKSDSATLGPVITYAQKRGDVFVVIDCPPNTAPSGSPPGSNIVAIAQGLGATAQAAFYYPQVQISDPYSSVAGRTRIVPPGGFVVGQYIATDLTRGVSKAPAGLATSLLGATGLEFVLTHDEQGTLTQGNVNCLISIPGTGPLIWGARTLSPYQVTRYVPVERSLIYLQTQLVSLTRFAVFEPNDWVLWNQVASVISQFLNAFWQSGGLSGLNASQAFYVTCDDTINTPATIQQGIVNIEVGVALEYPAEFVVISIGQWAGGQSVSTTTA